MTLCEKEVHAMVHDGLVAESPLRFLYTLVWAHLSGLAQQLCCMHEPYPNTIFRTTTVTYFTCKNHQVRDAIVPEFFF